MANLTQILKAHRRKNTPETKLDLKNLCGTMMGLEVGKTTKTVKPTVGDDKSVRF